MRDLPQRWRLVTLNDLQADEPRAITDGPFGSHLTSAHYTAYGPRVVRLQNIGDGVFHDHAAHISDEHFQSLRAHEVLPGDLLIASLGEVLPRACLAPASLGPAIVKADCIRVRVSPAVDSRWVMYAMQRPKVRKWAEDHRHGVGRPRLGLKVIRQIPVPLPPPEEQRRIVDILEDHLSRLTAARESLAEAVARARALVHSMVDRAADGRLLGGIVGENGLADGWRWGTPDEVAGGVRSNIVIGPFGSSLKTTDYRPSGVPLVFVRNVRTTNFGPEGRRYVSPAKATELASHTVVKGDVVVTKMGDPPGDAAVYDEPEPGIVTADVIRVRPASEFLGSYLAMAINSTHVARQIQQITRGVAQKKVSLARFRSDVRIPAPDLATQAEVCGRVDQLRFNLSRLLLQIAAGERRHVALRHALLAAAFSGRLTGRAVDTELVEEMAGV